MKEKKCHAPPNTTIGIGRIGSTSKKCWPWKVFSIYTTDDWRPTNHITYSFQTLSKLLNEMFKNLNTISIKAPQILTVTKWIFVCVCVCVLKCSGNLLNGPRRYNYIYLIWKTEISLNRWRWHRMIYEIYSHAYVLYYKNWTRTWLSSSTMKLTLLHIGVFGLLWAYCHEIHVDMIYFISFEMENSFIQKKQEKKIHLFNRFRYVIETF